MRTIRLLLAPLLLAAGVASASDIGAASASDVVVLKGGVKIVLKQAPVRQGNNVLLTRKDGTLLSVPASEIDAKATAAAKAAPAAPPSKAEAAAPATPAQAARATREGPKARVRLTDADVGHYLEPAAPGEAAGEGGSSAAGAAGGTGARVDVAEYTQSKAGDNLIVKGTVRNLGTAAALSTRITVTALDDKGQSIDSSEASMATGTIEPGRSVNFTASIPVGSKAVGMMRFSPRWVSQAPPGDSAPASSGPGSGAAASSAASSAASNTAAAPSPAAPAAKPPAPAPTPYGQGLTYAAPAPNASMAPPADGKTGYIPGAASPDNQPKPPDQ